MPNFSITIEGEDGPATFSPDPQPVPANSVVTWNNTTNVTHKLKLGDGRVTDDILPEQSSAEYVIATSVTYECITKNHDGEEGSIDVVAIQDIPPC